MPWMVETHDRPGSAELRLRLRPDHLAFLKRHKDLLLACGAKLDDAGKTASGGVYLLDVATRAEAHDFIKRDPFFQGDLFERVVIQRWRKAYLDGRNMLDED